MIDVFRGNKCYSLDDQFRLHIRNDIVLPCQRINLPNLNIGIIGNSVLNPRRLLILPQDREPIAAFNPETIEEYEIKYPGKSAFIHEENCPSRRHELAVIEKACGLQPDRRDHIYLSTVSAIESTGWQVWWAPIQMRGLITHCRLIPEKVIRRGVDPTLEDATRLAQVFVKQN